MPASPVFTPDYSAFLGLPTTAWLDVLADQLDLQLAGGRASDDGPYDWPYLRLCVQQAFDAETAELETANLALNQADYLARKKDEQDSYFVDLKARTEFWETPERWLQSYPAPLGYDPDRYEQYFVLPPAFVALRRYQNLPSENTVRDVQPRDGRRRGQFRFCYLPTGAYAHRSLPGGLLGRFGFYTEQTTVPGATGAAVADEYRVYLEPPKPGLLVPGDVPLLMYLVLRDARASALPPPPLRVVQAFTVVRRALELALLRTKMDKVPDANPAPTQP